VSAVSSAAVVSSSSSAAAVAMVESAQTMSGGLLNRKAAAVAAGSVGQDGCMVEIEKDMENLASACAGGVFVDAVVATQVCL